MGEFGEKGMELPKHFEFPTLKFRGFATGREYERGTGIH